MFEDSVVLRLTVQNMKSEIIHHLEQNGILEIVKRDIALVCTEENIRAQIREQIINEFRKQVHNIVQIEVSAALRDEGYRSIVFPMVKEELEKMKKDRR